MFYDIQSSAKDKGAKKSEGLTRQDSSFNIGTSTTASYTHRPVKPISCMSSSCCLADSDDSFDLDMPEEASPKGPTGAGGAKKRMSLPGNVALEDSFAQLMGDDLLLGVGSGSGRAKTPYEDDFEDEEERPSPINTRPATGGRRVRHPST